VNNYHVAADTENRAPKVAINSSAIVNESTVAEIFATFNGGGTHLSEGLTGLAEKTKEQTIKQ